MTSFIHRRKFTVVIQKKALFWGRLCGRGHFMEFLRICKKIEIKIDRIKMCIVKITENYEIVEGMQLFF